MKLFLNGVPTETSVQTVEQLIQEKGLEPRTLLVEHNGAVAFRSDWPQTFLQEGDRVEFFRVSAGG